MAEMLRRVADRAEAGEIQALVVVWVTTDGGVGDGVSTPENALYPMLGGLEAIKAVVLARGKDRRAYTADFDPKEPA